MKRMGSALWGRFSGSGAFLPLAAVLAGLAAGLTAALYRLALEWASSFLGGALAFAAASPLHTLAWFLCLVLLAALVAKLLKWQPLISGSGIPQVEGEVQGLFRPQWFKVLAAKFAGGFLCLLGGLSLGREGPSIQLGAMAGRGVSRLLRRPAAGGEERLLLSCGAGAGLAAAFHAPAAGVLFCLEEVHRSFSPKLALPLLAATVSADFLACQFFGLAPVFSFPVEAQLSLPQYGLAAGLGVLMGVLGAFYNLVTMKAVRLLQDSRRLTRFLRLLAAFLAAGVLGLVCPALLGSGHELAEQAAAGEFLAETALLLLVGKFLFSTLSFGSGAPGGIFFPLLVMGALAGFLYGSAAVNLLGLDPALVNLFILLAMAANFAAIVRAPLTGAVLLFEMSGSLPCLLPLLAVSLVAYATAALLRSQPIYDSLLLRLRQSQPGGAR